MRLRFLVPMVMLISFVVLPGAHCRPGAGWDAFKTCEAPTVKTDLPQVLPLVIDILISKGSDTAAAAALAGLTLKMGKDLIQCAVVGAVTALSPAPATQPTFVWRAGMPSKDDAAKGTARGKAWLQTQGITIGGSP